jgi:hemin uptake protein HemP
MFNENGLGDHGADTARPPESGKSNDNMDKKDNEIAHISIVSRTANAMNMAQFTIRQGHVAVDHNGNVYSAEVGPKDVKKYAKK